MGDGDAWPEIQDLDKTPEKTAATTATLAANTAHLARRLKATSYPPSTLTPAVGHAGRRLRCHPTNRPTSPIR